VLNAGSRLINGGKEKKGASPSARNTLKRKKIAAGGKTGREKAGKGGVKMKTEVGYLRSPQPETTMLNGGTRSPEPRFVVRSDGKGKTEKTLRPPEPSALHPSKGSKGSLLNRGRKFAET